MKYYSSKDATKLFGVTSQTLRRWDQEGKLKPAYTRDNGYRYYSEEDLLAFLTKRNNKNDQEIIDFILSGKPIVHKKPKKNSEIKRSENTVDVDVVDEEFDDDIKDETISYVCLCCGSKNIKRSLGKFICDDCMSVHSIDENGNLYIEDEYDNSKSESFLTFNGTPIDKFKLEYDLLAYRIFYNKCDELENSFLDKRYFKDGSTISDNVIFDDKKYYNDNVKKIFVDNYRDKKSVIIEYNKSIAKQKRDNKKRDGYERLSNTLDFVLHAIDDEYSFNIKEWYSNLFNGSKVLFWIKIILLTVIYIGAILLSQGELADFSFMTIILLLIMLVIGCFAMCMSLVFLSPFLYILDIVVIRILIFKVLFLPLLILEHSIDKKLAKMDKNYITTFDNFFKYTILNSVKFNKEEQLFKAKFLELLNEKLDAFKDNSNKLYRLNNDLKSAILLPIQFTKKEYVSPFLSLLLDCRANNIKEAISIYENNKNAVSTSMSYLNDNIESLIKCVNLIKKGQEYYITNFKYDVIQLFNENDRIINELSSLSFTKVSLDDILGKIDF